MSTKQPAKLPSPWQLLKSAVRQYADSWREYVIITGVIIVPVSVLLNLFNDDPVLTAYLWLPLLLMNLAVIWETMEHQEKHGVKLGEAYYHGTGQIVSFLLVLAVLAFQMLPLVLGAFIYSSITGGGTLSAPTGELWLMGIVWLLLALVSLFWLTGSIFAIFSVQDPQVSPKQALRTSRQGVKARRPAVSGRLFVALLVFVVLPAIPWLALTYYVPSAGVRWATSVWDVISTMTILPLAYIYILRLYLSL